MNRGLILYGPPAAGKDTIAAALCQDRAFVAYELMKVGDGRSAGYRMRTRDQLDKLSNDGDVLWSATRYDATYAIDRSGLTECLHLGIAVVQLGQPAAITAVMEGTAPTSWTIAHLWCPRPIAAQRLRSRNPRDVDRRLAVWDHTGPVRADIIIDTATTTIDAATTSIVRCLPEPIEGAQ